MRVVFDKPGFVIPMPDSPWIECEVVDISQSGVCLDVGTLFVPELFGVAFNPSGDVLRVCQRVWRDGPLIGARFVSAKELRGGVKLAPLNAKRELEQVR
ncbi:MAG: hypothetical protein JSS22_02615 [Proteobacteria bacterium]|nr:hypothetical protein [Pseudomonadota bacterium]